MPLLHPSTLREAIDTSKHLTLMLPASMRGELIDHRELVLPAGFYAKLVDVPPPGQTRPDEGLLFFGAEN